MQRKRQRRLSIKKRKRISVSEPARQMGETVNGTANGTTNGTTNRTMNATTNGTTNRTVNGTRSELQQVYSMVSRYLPYHHSSHIFTLTFEVAGGFQPAQHASCQQ
jgi:hypothetical protein